MASAPTENLNYQLRVLHAAADGVEPALLLTAPGRKAEYLFNVPDGFSRLALEHKLSPSARLSCVFLTSLLPTSTGGLGGLLLKLRHDGHDQIQVVGPRGSSRIIHSLRHVCRWQHPKVFVSECCENEPVPVFQDEHIVIIPLVAGDRTTCCPWCMCGPPSASQPKATLLRSSGQTEVRSAIREVLESSSSSEDSWDANLVPLMGEKDEGDSLEERTNVCNGSSHRVGIAANPVLGNGIPTTNVFEVRGGIQSRTQEGGCDMTGLRKNLPHRRKRQCAEGELLPLESDKSFFGQIRDELKRARQIVRCSGKVDIGAHAKSSASRNEQTRLKAPSLCSGDLSMIPCADDGNSDAQMFVTEFTALNEIAEGIPNRACQPDSASKEIQCVPQPRYSSPSMLASEIAPELASRRCDETLGLGEYSGTLQGTRSDCAGGCSSMTATAEVASQLGNGAALPKVPLIQPTRVIVRYISNMQTYELPPLPHDFNPVFTMAPSGQCNVVVNLAIEKHSHNERTRESDASETVPASNLGYICYLQKMKKVLLIVDCKDGNSVPSLIKLQILSCLSYSSGLKGGTAEETVKSHDIAAVVHLTPHHIVQSQEYQKWMQSFRCTSHVVMNEELPEFGFHSSLDTLRKLNKINQIIFPLPATLSSQSKDRPTFLELSEPESRIVNAKLCMCLEFCESTTIFHSLKTTSVCSFPSNFTSLTGASLVTPELQFQKVEDLNSDTSGYLHSTPNGIAAAAVKRKLLKQKKSLSAFSNISKDMGNNVDNTRVRADELLNSAVCSAGQNGRNAILHNGDENDSTLCTSQDNFNHDVQRHFDVPSAVPSSGIANVYHQLPTPDEVSREYVSMKDVVAVQPLQKDRRLLEPESEFLLTFLGTGSAEPSKKRGSSGILLQVRGAKGAMLLDAGEGTAGQLIRRFGDMGARAVISSLQCLWVSHKHGDHALGVRSILQMRSPLVAPLIVIGPHAVYRWLSEVRNVYETTDGPVSQFVHIHCEELSDLRYMRNLEHRKRIIAVLRALELQSMVSAKVIHCYDAYGIILYGKTGWKVVYSGDTRPCKQLVDAGQGCTVLIHEATFEDSLLEHAKQKRHSTVSEAVDMGLQMNACQIILTHFSQRYPEMVDIPGVQSENISLAFDGMVVPSFLLGSLGKLLPLIRTVCQNFVKSTPKPENLQGHNKITAMCSTGRTVEPRLVRSEKECPVAKHTRWSSNSDDEEEGVQQTIRWSLDSDECTQLNKIDNTTLTVSLSKGSSGAKHTRWSSDSDDEQAACACTTGGLQSIRWSSDSDS